MGWALSLESMAAARRGDGGRGLPHSTQEPLRGSLRGLQVERTQKEQNTTEHHSGGSDEDVVRG